MRYASSFDVCLRHAASCRTVQQKCDLLFYPLPVLEMGLRSKNASALHEGFGISRAVVDIYIELEWSQLLMHDDHTISLFVAHH